MFIRPGGPITGLSSLGGGDWPGYDDIDRDGLDDAWRRWELHSCVERHGGHLWVLSGDPCEEWAGVDLACSYCRAWVDDLVPDGQDLITGTINNIRIEYGAHNSVNGFKIPVTTRVEITKYFSPSTMIRPELDILIIVDADPRR